MMVSIKIIISGVDGWGSCDNCGVSLSMYEKVMEG